MPQSLLIAQAFSTFRNFQSASPADTFGANIFHQDLTEMIALHTPHTIVTIPPLVGETNHRGVDRQLRGQIVSPQAIVGSLENLAAGAIKPDIFLNAGCYYNGPLQMRSAIGGNWAVCSIVHSLTIGTPVAIPTLTHYLLASEPGDVLVVSSRAARLAIQGIFECLCHSLGDRLGVSILSEINIREIPLAVNTDRLRPGDRQYARSTLEVPDDAFVILYLGRISSKDKGDLHPLLRALRAMQKATRQRCLLVVAGKPDDTGYAEELHRYAEEIGVSERLRIIRDFPAFSKTTLFRAADVFVSPSDNLQETFGLTLLEAMACGIPVIASDWSGYREIVEEGKTGHLISTYMSKEISEHLSHMAQYFRDGSLESELARFTVFDEGMLTDRLLGFIRQPELAVAMGKSARLRVEEMYSMQKLKDQLESLWLEQMKQRSTARIRRWDHRLSISEVFASYPTAFVEDINLINSPAESERLNGAASANRTKDLLRDWKAGLLQIEEQR